MRLVRLPEDECYKYSATDAFATFDNLGVQTGACFVIPYTSRELRDCPLNTYLKFEGQNDALPMLYGAGLACTMARHGGRDGAVRLYTSCDAADSERLKTLVAMGLRNDDAAFSMERELTLGPIMSALPQGMSWINDALEDADDRRRCLQRINASFCVPRQPEWLEELRGKAGFQRIAAVSPDGLVAELLLHIEDDTGVIDMLIVDNQQRHRGIGGFLLEMARITLLRNGVSRVRAEVWQRLRTAMSLFEMMGYHSYTPTRYYPGIMLLPAGMVGMDGAPDSAQG